jgi:hypothetical protein
VKDNPSSRFDEFIPKVWDDYDVDYFGGNESKNRYSYSDIYEHHSGVHDGEGGFKFAFQLLPSFLVNKFYNAIYTSHWVDD